MTTTKQIDMHGRSDNDKKAVDDQVQELQKIVDYEIREYPVEVLVQKFVDGLEEDAAELFIPDYQREFVWAKNQQSRFIESILLNLPIPYIFVADVKEGKHEGRLEIVDGSQRVRTLVAFMQNNLCLSGLKKITTANGFSFNDLSVPRQMRFKRKTMRTIELTESTDEEARREIFDRLNSGGTPIKPMEQRRGGKDGKFLEFLEDCAKKPEFSDLCPVSSVRQKRQEPLELVLRYFAYCDRYQNFDKRVDEFLDDYLDNANLESTNSPDLVQNLNRQFQSMLSFVKKNFPDGFRKDANNKSVPRIRFEAIAVGVTLALRERPDLQPLEVTDWLQSKQFKLHTRSDASNSRPKVINRIHFVRDHLLGRPVEYVPGGDLPGDGDNDTAEE